MKPLITMVGAGLLVGLMATSLLGMPVVLETTLGTLGPLVAACGSWIVIERTMKREPTQVTPTMLKLFAVKMLFFGAYVAVMLKVVGLHPIPFVVSFTGYFIALYLTEALLMRRLFAGG